MELLGKESLGGAIFRANIDVTHPLGFGYTQSEIPVYKNKEKETLDRAREFADLGQVREARNLTEEILKSNPYMVMVKQDVLKYPVKLV